ncbi:MAG TPA: glycosyltransferase [Chthoniobacterales bacterium]|jgi:hypothetical protein
MTLPISVIVPTRNAMGSIEPHIDAISAWLPDVAQVIVVDSSDDGTFEYLRERLSDLPHAEFYARPPGLYEAWNFAVSRASAEFVYFSTVGDAIDVTGLGHLLAVAQETAADMVLSPPEMFDENGVPHPRKWPIHHLCDELEDTEPCLLDPVEAFILSTSAVPETVLGSSASNLYRRAFLAARPFPEAWGHDADSAWMISHGLHARIVITPRCISRFVVHSPTGGNRPSEALTLERFDRMSGLAPLAARGANLPERTRSILAGWNASLNVRTRQFLNRITLNRGHIEQRDQRIERLLVEIEGLKGRIGRLETSLADSRAEATSFREKTVKARAELADYERRHRSGFLLAGLYFRAKRQQVQRLVAMLTKGKKSGQ